LAAQSTMVYIEKSQIAAPVVSLTSKSGGTLKNVYVSVGDTVAPNTIVAAVGTELIKSTTGGIIVDITNDIGKRVSPQDVIAKMIDPTQLRVVGQVEEDKGFKDIHVGQRVIFTVDAFGSRKFVGVVDEVSPTSHEGDVVFNISDK